MNKKNQLNIGSRVGELRKRRKMTLDELSALSGVSKSILSQIERNISNPTVSTMVRIADALGETLSGFFMEVDDVQSDNIETSKETPVINSKDGLCSLSILGVGETVSWLQWYILTMKPTGQLSSKSHGNHTFENLTMINGEIEIKFKKKSQLLKTGDTFRFQSNIDHTLINNAKTIAKILMVNYIDPINGTFN